MYPVHLECKEVMNNNFLRRLADGREKYTQVCIRFDFCQDIGKGKLEKGRITLSFTDPKETGIDSTKILLIPFTYWRYKNIETFGIYTYTNRDKSLIDAICSGRFDIENICNEKGTPLKIVISSSDRKYNYEIYTGFYSYLNSDETNDSGERKWR